MALSAWSLPQDRSGSLIPTDYRQQNDGFSFWKLPATWRDALEPTIAASERAAAYYLREEYLSTEDRRPPALMHLYYRIKRLIPHTLRHRLNALAIRMRPDREFPQWPCEDALIDLWRDWLHSSLRLMELDDSWHIGFWPRGYRCCIVLTHDVDSLAGFQHMEQMAELEEQYGFRSAWNLPLKQYRIDWKRVDRMRERGFEFGAHGLSHDGKLFRSESDFNRLAPSLERMAREQHLDGFRAPSTLRRGEWIGRLKFGFDSSFSDSDPYEPQPGGTCSLFPFFLQNLVELPYTLPQDHTLIHLLRRDPMQVWAAKSRWIESLGGMILSLTHPDYCGSGPHLKDYEKLLRHLSAINSAWRALPSEVASWWRQRDAMQLTLDGEQPNITGPGAERAVARRLSSEPLAG